LVSRRYDKDAAAAGEVGEEELEGSQWTHSLYLISIRLGIEKKTDWGVILMSEVDEAFLS
jgi:hypothetical protein